MDPMNIGNICSGAVPEVFDRAVREISNNLKDPNTNSGSKRKIVLEFTFEPFADRSGAEITFTCTSKLSSVTPARGTMFVTGTHGKAVAYAKDPRQDALFTEEPASNTPS